MGQEGAMGFAGRQPQRLFLVTHFESSLLIMNYFCAVASVMTV